MKRRSRRVASAVAALTATALLAACGSSGSDAQSSSVKAGGYTGPKVTVTFWNGWTGGNAPQLVPKLVNSFNSSHSNIVVKDVPMQWADIEAKMPLAVKAGKGPDLVVGEPDWISTYAGEGLLLPADSFVKSAGYTASSFPPGDLANGKYNGKQYGVPWSVTPLALYVNKSVLSKAGLSTTNLPTDSQSYDKEMAALRAKGIQGGWVDPYFFTGVFQFETLLWQNGGELFNTDKSKSTFNSPAGVKALTWMVDQIKQGNSPANVAQDGDINALITGKTAFNWNGVWQTTNDALTKVNWTAAPVPQIGEKKAVWSSSTDWAFVNNAGKEDTNVTQAASVFVQWMNDHSLGWADTGELPADNKVRDDPKLLQQHPDLKPFLEELEYAHFETVSPGIVNAEAQINTAVNNAILLKQTPQAALSTAATKADQILQQNKQEYGD